MDWCAQEFAQAELGDLRLKKRLIKLSQSLLAHPSQSIPAACGDWANSKAAYRFFDNKNVTAEKILAPHLSMIKSRTSCQNVVLAIQDSTYLNLDSFDSMDGLGFVDCSNKWAHKGIVFHPSVAFTPEGQCLGLLGYKIYSRSESREYSRHDYMMKPIHEKESYRWVESLANNVSICSPKTDVVTIGDRESDIYELFQEAKKLQTFYLVRAAIDRYIYDEEFPSKKEQKLSDFAYGNAAAGYYHLDIPAHEGRQARTTRVEIKFFETTLKPPQRRASAVVEPLLPLDVWICTVTETSPPPGIAPLRWVLLTNHPIESIEEACEKIHWYKARWQIEVYFKVLKSGFRIEKTRFGNVSNLEKYIVMMAVLATRVMNLTNYAKTENPGNIHDHFSEIEIHVLGALIPKRKIHTLSNAAAAVAMLGGYLGRKNDGPPGVITIWRGMSKLAEACTVFLKLNSTYG